MSFSDQVKTVALVAAKSLKNMSLWSSIEEVNRRLSICSDCEYVRKPKQRRWKCKLCGCKLQLKVAAKYSECPDKRW